MRTVQSQIEMSIKMFKMLFIVESIIGFISLRRNWRGKNQNPFVDSFYSSINFYSLASEAKISNPLLLSRWYWCFFFLQKQAEKKTAEFIYSICIINNKNYFNHKQVSYWYFYGHNAQHISMSLASFTITAYIWRLTVLLFLLGRRAQCIRRQLVKRRYKHFNHSTTYTFKTNKYGIARPYWASATRKTTIKTTQMLFKGHLLVHNQFVISISSLYQLHQFSGVCYCCCHSLRGHHSTAATAATDESI